jgi:hypothetical protein
VIILVSSALLFWKCVLNYDGIFCCLLVDIYTLIYLYIEMPIMGISNVMCLSISVNYGNFGVMAFLGWVLLKLFKNTPKTIVCDVGWHIYKSFSGNEFAIAGVLLRGRFPGIP